jgi:hypothetical protein
MNNEIPKLFSNSANASILPVEIGRQESRVQRATLHNRADK